jgi:THO complex subunit 3
MVIVFSLGFVHHVISFHRSQDGKTIAVGNKEDLVSFIDVKGHKILHEEQFKFEVNEIAFNPDSNLFFLTNGQVKRNLFLNIKIQ